MISGPWFDLLVRDTALLLLAWALGGLVGWQREAQGRAAGLRTHVLVCLGSCLITLVSFGGLGDPGRIAAQIVTGIGFLGAGTILHRGMSVRGLTTAATIWVVAGIGIAVGAGGVFAGVATVATALVLLTLTLAKRLEDAITKAHLATLSVTLPRKSASVSDVLQALTAAGADVVGFESNDEDSRRSLLIHLRLRQDVTRSVLARVVSDAAPGASLRWE